MKRNTIKWRIFKYNLIVIFLLISLTTLVFNVAVRIYIENDIGKQLSSIASRTEDTALRQGPDIFPDQGRRQMPPPEKPKDQNGNVIDNPHSINPPPNLDQSNNASQDTSTQSDSEILKFFFKLDRTLRETLSLLNANYVLLGSDKKTINPAQEGYFNISDELLNKISEEISKHETSTSETFLNFKISGTEYIGIIKPVSEKNTFGLGWVVIYSNLQKVNQLQIGINVILLIILILSSLVIAVFSSLAAKKISAPFSSLNDHIAEIAERNFDTKIHMPVDDELQEFVNNINVMSEKLEVYDKAQKTFLQNASHEFRTPLMSIQSYAEGIKYEVVDNATAVDVIIDETKRMTRLVEDLLYLSRLEAIEENYRFDNWDFKYLVSSCLERLNGIAIKTNKKIVYNNPDEMFNIHGDDEKLSRAITNIASNCLRYAEATIEVYLKKSDHNTLTLSIKDDGPGLDPNELPYIFDRFYKGKKGNFGLGLAIAKNVIEKHKGKITAKNSESGALFIIELPLETKKHI